MPTIDEAEPMTDILELAKRVEALDGPDRSINEEIANIFGHMIVDRNYYVCAPYTASLDAAMTLIGPEWTYIKSDICARGTPDQHCSYFLQRLVGDDEETESGFAKHPALALVAAALRAKAALGGEQHGG